MATIRQARPDDATAIAAIWNPVIRSTTVTFNSVARTPPEIAALIDARRAQGQPWIVAETAAGPVGFATYAQFRPGVGYAHTMEHTIMLDPQATGQGIGRRLMDALIAEARGRDVRLLIGAISAENTGAIAFHARCGFAEVGRIPAAGRKFDRWLDLVLMQLRL